MTIKELLEHYGGDNTIHIEIHAEFVLKQYAGSLGEMPYKYLHKVIEWWAVDGTSLEIEVK